MEQTKKCVPKLRFPQFTEEWEEKKLGDFGNIAMNRRIYKEQTKEKGDIPFYKIGTFGGTPNAFISRELFVEYKNKYPYPQKGDILISASGSIGKTVEYMGDEEYFQDSNIVWLNHNGKLDNQFLKQFYSGIKWNISEGSAIKRLYNKDILETDIKVPSKMEQQKIGEFFQKLDTQIAAQQQKIAHLKQKKKGLLQKMFSQSGQITPQVRFTGFTQPWEEKKLGEVLVKNSKKNKDLSIDNVESISNKTGFTKQTEQFEDYTVASDNLSNYYVITERQFAYNPSRINVGSIAYKKKGEKTSVVSPLYVSFSTKKDIDDMYFWYWLKTPLFEQQRKVFAEGGVRDTLSFEQLKQIVAVFPNSTEQQKIGEFFQQFDAFIALQEQKLAHLQHRKKGLLQQMFV